MPSQTDYDKLVFELQTNPILFYETFLGASPEKYQSDILNQIVKHNRVAVRSAHNLGKSWLTARLVLWFGICFPHSKIITTAPTHNQVKNILWSEIHTAYKNAKVSLGGTLNFTEWRLDSDWFALGFTPRNELSGEDGQGTVSTFQGFHAPGGVLVVFDEATGIPPSIWTMAEGLLTQVHTKFVCIGNPTSRSGDFAQCFKSPEWVKINLSCFDSPNLIANGISNLAALENELRVLKELPEAQCLERLSAYKTPRPHLLSCAWVLGRALKWGLNHPLFVSKCLGEFPEGGNDVLIPLHVVEAAQRRERSVKTDADRRTIGVDVARFGTDQTVLTRMHGAQVCERRVLVQRDTGEVTGAVISMIRESGFDADVIVVDGTGIGAGVVDQLKTAQKENTISEKTEIREVHFGESADAHIDDEDQNEFDKQHFVNLKAKMFQLLADDLKKNIELLEDEIYLEELPTIIYGFDNKGRTVIESKEAYKKRTGRNSPDNADSLMLANFGRYGEVVAPNLFDNSNTRAPMAAPLNSGDNW